MRNDFMLMKDLAVHTRVDPKTRNKSLLKFMGDIQRYAEGSLCVQFMFKCEEAYRRMGSFELAVVRFAFVLCHL